MSSFQNQQNYVSVPVFIDQMNIYQTLDYAQLVDTLLPGQYFLAVTSLKAFNSIWYKMKMNSDSYKT